MRRIKGLAAIPARHRAQHPGELRGCRRRGRSRHPDQELLRDRQRSAASVVGDTGEHASSFDEPRLGIGQLIFKVFGFTSIGEAGSFLATVDGIDATSCD
jgi:hypothetical protein